MAIFGLQCQYTTMKTLTKYKDGSVYINDDHASLSFPGVVPEEEIDISNATKEEIKKLKEKPRDKKLLKEITSRQK